MIGCQRNATVIVNLQVLCELLVLFDDQISPLNWETHVFGFLPDK